MVGDKGRGVESLERSLRTTAGLLTVVLEGLEDGAVAAGLPLSTARAFARQTLLSTTLLLQEHDCSPAQLKDQVASPAGTTIAGLAVLEDGAVRGALLRAMESGVGTEPGRKAGGAPPGAADGD